jgi:hypothetical protein
MNKNKWDIDTLKGRLDSLKKERKSYSWKMTLPILEDILNRNLDLFILIILCRDLRKKKADIPNEQICWSEYEKEYNEKYGFDNPDSFELVNRFFDCIKPKKDFVLDHIKIDLNTIFPSSYHIYFCDFRTPNRSSIQTTI